MFASENRRKWLSSAVTWSVVVLAIAFSAYVRLRLLQCPLERDEGEYAYAGQLILRGIPPYQLTYNMKLPGTYLTYAGLMFVFGETTAGIHFGVLLVNVGAILLLFLLARELFDAHVAALAAAAYSILSASYSVLGTAGHATHFVVLFTLPGIWLLWKGLRKDSLAMLFTSGLLLGTAFLMKQQAVFLLAFGGLASLFQSAPFQSWRWRRVLAHGTTYGAGGILPYAVICGWLWYAGVFDKFWFWTVTYAREYVNQVPFQGAAERFLGRFANIMVPNLSIVILSLVGLIVVARSVKRETGRSFFVLGMLLVTILCTCPGYYFRNHYFIVVLPMIALLFGIGSVVSLRWAAKWRLFITAPRVPSIQAGSRRRQTGPAPEPAGIAAYGFLFWPLGVLVIASLIFPIWRQRDLFIYWSAREASRKLYGRNPFPESDVIADYIRSHTTPEQCIAVLGSEPQIFFLAKRISATSYIYMYELMEAHPFARQMQ